MTSMLEEDVTFPHGMEWDVNNMTNLTSQYTQNFIELFVEDADMAKELLLARCNHKWNERNVNIVYDYSATICTYDDCAKKYNLTRERIRQICCKYWRIYRGLRKYMENV